MPKIIDGICNCPDICKKTDCPFFHLDEASIRRYIEMVSEEHAYPWKKYPRQQPPADCPLTQPTF